MILLNRWPAAVYLVLFCIGVFPHQARAQGAAGVSVTTFHNGNARLGWNARETRLSPARVRSSGFGLLWRNPLDGEVPASPLYVPGLSVGGRTADVVYAATDHNSVYALDAHTGRVLWARPKLAAPLSDAQMLGNWNGDHIHGILGTPVIDPDTGTLYACAVRARGLTQAYEVWALDIRTGATRAGWPVTLKGSDGGTPFVAGEVFQRGALALVNGWVYVPFGGRYDTPPWRGWVVGVDTHGPGAPQRAFSPSPRADGAGIWSGGGLSADADGALYAVTGNGEPDPDGHSLAQSVLRLADGARFSGQSRDFYTPANFRFLNDEDEDLGGATANVLPDLPGCATPHLLFTGGKDGLAYLLNRDDLGGVGGELQEMRLFCDPKSTYHEGIRATSAFWDAGPHGRLLFVAGDNPGPAGQAGMVALRLTADGPNGRARFRQVWTLPRQLSGPSSPAVSSDGPHGGVVWIVETDVGDHSALLAYDALSGRPLYDSNARAGRDQLRAGHRFTSPTVADGRVLVGADGVVCYGLRGRGTAGKGAL